MPARNPGKASTPFLHRESLQNLLADIEALIGIPLRVTDSDLHPVVKSTAPKKTTRSGLVCLTRGSHNDCLVCRKAWAAKAAADRNAKVFCCPDGFIYLVAPLVHDMALVGYLFGGPVRVAATSTTLPHSGRQTKRSAAGSASFSALDADVAAGSVIALPRLWYVRRAKALGIGVEPYMASVGAISVLPKESLGAAARMLDGLTNAVLRQSPRATASSEAAAAPFEDTLRPSEIGRVALNQLHESLPFRTASLQVIQDDDRSLLAGIGYGDVAQDPQLLRPISDDPLLTRLVNGQGPLVLSDTSQDPDWRTMPSTAAVRSWIGAPVVFNHEVIGVITVDHDQPGFYQDSHKQILADFTRQIAQQVWNARLLVRNDRLSRDMRIFEEVLQVISAKLGIEELLQTIATQIAERLNCSHCTIFLAEPAGDDVLLVPEVTRGDRPETMTRHFRPGEGLAGWVFESGRSVMLSDATHDPRFAEARSPRTEARSMLVAPIKVGDQAIGVISADQDALGWFRRSDQLLVDALAQQAGIAIQRSRTLTLLHDIGNRIIGPEHVDVVLREVISGAIRLTNTTTGVIYLISDDGLTVTDALHLSDFPHPQPRMEDPNGLTRTAVRTGEVRVIRDTLGVPNLNPRLSEAFRSMIVVPMKLGERVVGVFYLHDKDPHDFTEMETTLLVTLASQAASAIQNARLLGSLQRDVRTHAVFDNVLKNLAVQEPDQEKTFEGIGRGIQDMLGKDVSLSINMYDQETRRFGECHSYGPLGELLNAPPRAEGGTGAFVVDKGLSLYLENVVNPPDGLPTVRPEAIEHGVRSFAAIPVKRRDQIVGVLFINSQAALTFDDQTRGLLELMALQAGVAIEIARFHASAHFQGALVKAADLGFLAGGIAHEFRNRLQNMEIHVRELELLSPPENMRSALVERLRTEMGRAAHAISTFQSFTHQRDEVTTLDLDGLMAQAVDVSRQRARDHGITLRHERADVGMVRMNATWVQSIVLNLLRNAIDATEGATGGRREVEVTLTSKTPDALEIEVKDSGPGIPSEVLSNLFLPFHTTKGGTGGFGLGLFWVQRLVQRMKGRLRVVAHNEWGGATFGVSLPRAHATDEGVGDHGALRIDR